MVTNPHMIKIIKTTNIIIMQIIIKNKIFNIKKNMFQKIHSKKQLKNFNKSIKIPNNQSKIFMLIMKKLKKFKQMMINNNKINKIKIR